MKTVLMPISRNREQLMTLVLRGDGLLCHYCKRRLYPASCRRVQKCNYRQGGRRGYFVSMPVKREFWATIDHKEPRILGGTDDENNLVIACSSCNSLKHVMPYEWALRFFDLLRDKQPGYFYDRQTGTSAFTESGSRILGRFR